MSTPAGHIELERAVESIFVGHRHRQDLGDLGSLVASIQREGMLQPVTITPDGHLICGARRLAAIRQLGWKTMNVWVRSGISDRLGQLLAEQDDNVLHKPLTQLEAAALYRELKALLAEDAARRQAATRFQPTVDAGGDGAFNLTAPSGLPSGEARVQSAQMVTGRDSHTTLERIGRLQALAADPAQPENVRAAAVQEVARIGAGAKVYASHQRINVELSLTELDQLAADLTQSDDVRGDARAEAERIRATDRHAKAAELERLAREALARIRATRMNSRRTPRPTLAAVESGEPVSFPLRAFVAIWDDMAGWWTHYNPTQVGPALSAEQWERFEQAIAGTVAFADAARSARDQQAQDIA